MSSSNILFLPFRKTHSLALSEAIKQYISSKYDQHPDMFTEDLQVIDRLRQDAATVREPHLSGIKKIAAYAAQLAWIGGKFPIDIGADFTWYPALGYNTERPTSQNNLKFELSNILYNLAALYSQLAMNSNRNASDGLKAACNYYSLAAGVIHHLKTVVIPELRSTPMEDMDDSSLESLEQLMLAQAQECFWQKAVVDGYKDASIAKLAVRVSDFYITAHDWGKNSEAISSEWLHHMVAKHHHFAAAAQYRQACYCLEKTKYGEEVARLRDSMICINEGLKEIRYLNKRVADDLTGLKNRVLETLKRAERDNDMIYLSPVTPKSELKLLDRATMAIARVPKEIADPSAFIGDHGEFGRPLFAKLVPYSVHIAASIYEERRDRIVNTNIISELEILTTKLHNTLQSLNLPGSLQALEKPLGLPQSILSHAEELRQADALTRIQRSFSDTAKLKASDEAIYAEGAQLLNTEATEDKRLRGKYGTDRWNRADSVTAAPKLYAQVSEIDGYLKSAANSDELVRKKYRETEDMLHILTGSDRDIGQFVPSSRRVTIPPKLDEAATRLRASLNDVSRLESRRRRKIESLREKAKKDDIHSTILTEAARLEREYPSQQIVPAHFEDFFDKRLERYDPDIDSLKDEAEEQNRLIAQLEKDNAHFIAAKKGDTSGKEREQALQKLEGAYFKYKEVVSNLEVGRKFYNDLSKIVGRFRDEARAFAYERRDEAGRLESDLNLPQLSNLALQQQKQQQETANISSPRLPNRDPYNIRSSETPMPAPVPTRASVIPPPAAQPQGAVPGMWSPDMGIKFGGGGTNEKGVGQGNGRGQGGAWDPSAGVRFG